MHKAKDLLKRTQINTVSGLLALLMLWASRSAAFRWLFVLALVVISGVALWEYSMLLRKKGFYPTPILMILSSALYLSLTPWGEGALFWLPGLVLVATVFASFVSVAVRGHPAICAIATTFFGVVYIAVPSGMLLRILYFFPEAQGGIISGSWWMIYIIATTKISDIGGYLVGRAYGKRKLAPRLSPHKTIMGSLGGIVATLLVSLLFSFLGSRALLPAFSHFSFLHALLLGLLIALFAQMGDLAESLLKRDAQVKDSNTIPAVGGILDMIDSLLFTIPLLYYALHMGWVGR